MSDRASKGRPAFGLVAAVVAFATLLAGCDTLRRPTEAELRVREQCTDITGVVRKNYSLGADVSTLVARLGFHWASAGVVLSGEANERLIQLDYLCRQYATGKISSDEWASLQNAYIIASAKVAQTNPDPVAQAQLKENLEQLRAATAELARSRRDTASTLGSVENLLKAAAQSSQAELQAKLDALLGKFGDTLVADNRLLTEQLKATRERLDTVQTMLQTVLVRQPKHPKTDQVPSVPSPAPPSWSALALFKVQFNLNEASLTEEAKALLKQRFGAVKDALDYRVQLAGFTDTSGTPLMNERLSVARAEEVRDFLVDEVGLDSSKVFARGSSHTPARLRDGPSGRVVEVRARVQFMSTPK